MKKLTTLAAAALALAMTGVGALAEGKTGDWGEVVTR